MTNPGRNRYAGTRASGRVSRYRARTTASSRAPTWTGTNTWNRTENRAVSRARTGTWAGAGEWAGARAVAITRAR